MQIKKIFARVFFAAGVGAMLVSAPNFLTAQEEVIDEGSKCYDGNRQLCEKGSLPGGGTFYKYWV